VKYNGTYCDKFPIHDCEMDQWMLDMVNYSAMIDKDEKKCAITYKDENISVQKD
jgi:hypothetical protein